MVIDFPNGFNEEIFVYLLKDLSVTKVILVRRMHCNMNIYSSCVTLSTEKQTSYLYHYFEKIVGDLQHANIEDDKFYECVMHHHIARQVRLLEDMINDAALMLPQNISVEGLILDQKSLKCERTNTVVFDNIHYKIN